MSQHRSRSSELPSTVAKTLRSENSNSNPIGAKERTPSPLVRSLNNSKDRRVSSEQGGSSRSGSSMGLSTTTTATNAAIVRRTVADDILLTQSRRAQLNSLSNLQKNVPEKISIWERLHKETLQKDRHGKGGASRPAKPTIDWDTLEPPPRKANSQYQNIREKADADTESTSKMKVKRVYLSQVKADSSDVVIYTPHPGTKEPGPKRHHQRTYSNQSDTISEATDTTTTSAGAFVPVHKTPSRAWSESDQHSETGTDYSMVDCGSQVGAPTIDYKTALKAASRNREAHSLNTKELLRKGAAGTLKANDEDSEEEGK